MPNAPILKADQCIRVLLSTRKKDKAADQNSEGQDGSLASQSEDYEEDSWLVDDEDEGANNEVGTMQPPDGKSHNKWEWWAEGACSRAIVTLYFSEFAFAGVWIVGKIPRGGLCPQRCTTTFNNGVQH